MYEMPFFQGPADHVGWSTLDELERASAKHLSPFRGKILESQQGCGVNAVHGKRGSFNGFGHPVL